MSSTPTLQLQDQEKQANKDLGANNTAPEVYEPIDESELKRVIRKVSVWTRVFGCYGRTYKPSRPDARQIDKRLIPPLAILYLFSYLDRSALANASIFGFREDLGLSSVQYNLISTVSGVSAVVLTRAF